MVLQRPNPPQPQALRVLGRDRFQEQPIAPKVLSVPVTGEVVFDWWTKSEGFTAPGYSGVVADEFGLGAGEKLSAYVEGIRRIAAAPECKDRAVYAWCSGVHMAEGQSKEFVETVLPAAQRKPR